MSELWNSILQLPQARQAPLPKSIRPQLALLAEEAPAGDRWLHEIKFDGYRMLCRKDASDVVFLSRRGHDWSNRVASLVDAARQLPVKRAVLDGEVVVVTPSGVTSFAELQRAIHEPGAPRLVYYLFDLLYLDGWDLTAVPLEQRKAALASLVQAAAHPRLVYSEHLVGKGPEAFQQACQMGLEGIISKRRDQPYRAGRSHSWLKLKCLQSDDFLVGGYSRPAGSREGFGALLLGYPDPEGRLLFAGRVGTGFSDETLRWLRSKLRPLEVKRCPFVSVPTAERRGVTWTEPELVVTVAYTGWTGDGLLRHTRYRGLRDDVSAEEVTAPAAGDASRASSASVAVPVSLPAELAEIRFTHPERVVYPEIGATKLDVARYYVEIAPRMLPYLINRPLSIVRCPEGHEGECFYQKHPPVGISDSVRRVEVAGAGSSEEVMAVDDLVGLMGLIQFGALELHAWGATLDKIERPDLMTFDLDPDEMLPWRRVVEAAFELRELLEHIGLVSFAKLTGGKGVHLVVPLVRRHDWREVKSFSKAVAESLERRRPQHYTTNVSKAARRGKIYLDYLRNARGSTAIVPFSTRARAKAPLALPVDWSELSKLPAGNLDTLQNVHARLRGKPDPWADLPQVRQSITKAARQAIERTR